MSEAASETIAPTATGKVRGLTRHGVHEFRSIPYGAPPIGARRFRPPVAAEPWNDVRDCTEFGPVAPQLPSPLEAMLGAADPVCDEANSLSLTVFTPGLDDARRPVMFWVHGGAFVNGTGASADWYAQTILHHSSHETADGGHATMWFFSEGHAGGEVAVSLHNNIPPTIPEPSFLSGAVLLLGYAGRRWYRRSRGGLT